MMDNGLFRQFQSKCFSAFFTSDYANTLGIVISLLLMAQLAFQLVYRRGLPENKVTRYIVIGVLGLLFALCLMCVVYNATRLRYTTPIFDSALSYVPLYEYSAWSAYLVAALALVVFVIQAVFVVLEMDKRAREGQQLQPEKRKKIRHCDVWGPQVVMTLVEAVVNIVRFLLTLTGVLIVLQQFNIFEEQHMRRLSMFFFGKMISDMIRSIESYKIVYFAVTLLLFVFILPSQMILRSQKFASLFRPRDDAKIDWRQFWVKQLLTLFDDVEMLLAVFMYSYINESYDMYSALYQAGPTSAMIVLETFAFSVIYNMIKYPMVQNYYMTIVKTLLKVLLDVLIALYALAGFFVYSFFALVGLFTVKGFVTDVQGCSFGAEILKMLFTFLFYIFLIPIDGATIIAHPIVLMLKGFEAPMRTVLELFGVFAPDEQLADDTRLELPREKLRKDNLRRVPEVLEKIVVYGCAWLFFSMLLQRNMPQNMLAPFVWSISGICCVIVPAGLFYRRQMQEGIANLNQQNQSLLTQVSWVNHMGRNIRNLSLSNAQLTQDMNSIEVHVSAECPWLEKFRADQLRVAANFLPVVGPATSLVSNNFRLCFRGRFAGATNLVSNLVQFLLCGAAIFFALFVNRTKAQRSMFYVFFAVYFLWTLLEYFDDVQDFTLPDYRLLWKQSIDKCTGCRREVSSTQPLLDEADADGKAEPYSEQQPAPVDPLQVAESP